MEAWLRAAAFFIGLMDKMVMVSAAVNISSLCTKIGINLRVIWKRSLT